MYLLAFHAFLRVGEITAKSGGGNKHCILRENITFLPDSGSKPTHVVLRCSSFKHSTGKHSPTLLIGATDDVDGCPVTALYNYCKLRENSAGPLFTFMDGSPITHQYFNQHLQASLKWANLDCNLYKGHSFRIGAASTAAGMGISETKSN